MCVCIASSEKNSVEPAQSMLMQEFSLWAYPHDTTPWTINTLRPLIRNEAWNKKKKKKKKKKF